jgi:uncharacterized protein YggE
MKSFNIQFEHPKNFKDLLYGVLSLFVIVLIILGVVATVMLNRSSRRVNDQTSVITVQASGESFAAPDIAEFNFSIIEKNKEVSKAQTQLTNRMNALLTQLEKAGVPSEDISTQSVTVQPTYEWRTRGGACPVGSYCPDGEQIITGYEASHTVAIRLRDLTKIGPVVSLLGTADVTNLYGPQLTYSNPEMGKDEAREIAIERAREKAKSMAKAMGVRLGRVVSFQEDGMGYMPAYGGAEMAMDMAVTSAPMQKNAVPEATIAVGENKVTASVTIVYKIK